MRLSNVRLKKYCDYKLTVLLAIVLSISISGCSYAKFPWSKKSQTTTPPPAVWKNMESTPSLDQQSDSMVVPADIIDNINDNVEVAQPIAVEQVDNSSNKVANSIFFDFDRYDVAESYNSIIKLNTDYLLKYGQALVQIQGNTDDIGSVEYNMGLGMRRALALKNHFLKAGVASSQVEVVSFGSMKPKFSNTAQDRANNRRDDIIYRNFMPQSYTIDEIGLPNIAV